MSPPVKAVGAVETQPFGKYLLLERLAAGGMAEVFRAVVQGPAGVEKTVAVKRILPGLDGMSELTAMFIDEARIACSLTHVNIAQVFEFGEVGGVFYLAMELVEGSDLGRLQQAGRARGQRIPIELAAFIVAEAARGLAYAHDKRGRDGALLGIVHRDVSPQNLLLSYAGEVKVADFGIAKAAGKLHKTESGAVMGKLRYMSPEQVLGQPLDGRSDLFSLGVVLHELLTGRTLFDGAHPGQVAEQVQKLAIPAPSSVQPAVPAELDRICLKALARARDQRYTRAAELARDLSAFVGARAPGLGREDLGALVAEWVPRGGGPATATAAVAGAGGGIGLGLAGSPSGFAATIPASRSAAARTAAAGGEAEASHAAAPTAVDAGTAAERPAPSPVEPAPSPAAAAPPATVPARRAAPIAVEEQAPEATRPPRARAGGLAAVGIPIALVVAAGAGALAFRALRASDTTGGDGDGVASRLVVDGGGGREDGGSPAAVTRLGRPFVPRRSADAAERLRLIAELEKTALASAAWRGVPAADFLAILGAVDASVCAAPGDDGAPPFPPEAQRALEAQHLTSEARAVARYLHATGELPPRVAASLVSFLRQRNAFAPREWRLARLAAIVEPEAPRHLVDLLRQADGAWPEGGAGPLCVAREAVERLAALEPNGRFARWIDAAPIDTPRDVDGLRLELTASVRDEAAATLEVQLRVTNLGGAPRAIDLGAVRLDELDAAPTVESGKASLGPGESVDVRLTFGGVTDAVAEAATLRWPSGARLQAYSSLVR
jgi:hypothetical protein